MYYVSADESFRGYRILQSDCREGGWSPGVPPEFALAPPVLDADPFVSPDGRRLYFISTRHDPLNEDFDIYRVERRENGSWRLPTRLPAPVNSPASELLPRLDASGRLYFGSARPGGFGQGDIYVAIEGPTGGWSVENVGPPVSTAANEYEAEVSHDGESLVVVADRGDRSHLYHFHRHEGEWREVGRVPASPDVFQVGPLLSPAGDRLLFAQAIARLSGEFFVTDLKPSAAGSWPPACD